MIVVCDAVNISKKFDRVFELSSGGTMMRKNPDSDVWLIDTPNVLREGDSLHLPNKSVTELFQKVTGIRVVAGQTPHSDKSELLEIRFYLTYGYVLTAKILWESIFPFQFTLSKASDFPDKEFSFPQQYRFRISTVVGPDGHAVKVSHFKVFNDSLHDYQKVLLSLLSSKRDDGTLFSHRLHLHPKKYEPDFSGLEELEV